MEPTVNVIPDTEPGMAGIYGGFIKLAFNSGQGQPGLIPIQVGKRVYSVICPVLTAYITELLESPSIGGEP
jgi:hypothetical protein